MGFEVKFWVAEKPLRFQNHYLEDVEQEGLRTAQQQRRTAYPVEKC